MGRETMRDVTDPSQASILFGRLLGGRYRIVGLLGEGGMGVVYAAVQEDLQRRVAVKVLQGKTRFDENVVRRFRREALSAAELGHPNIVQVTDFQAVPGEPPFLVMEVLEGESLRARLHRERQLTTERTVFILRQILSALGAAHAARIVHRDIKPANVFLTQTSAMSDLVKVLDFGVAKILEDEDGGPHTMTGAMIGTLAYMAPEQAMGAEIDGRADLYAVGMCAYEMLTGSRPFAGKTSAALLDAIRYEVPAPLAVVRPELDPRLAAAVDRALAKDPRARFGSAEEMMRALAPEPPAVTAPPSPAASSPALHGPATTMLGGGPSPIDPTANAQPTARDNMGAPWVRVAPQDATLGSPPWAPSTAPSVGGAHARTFGASHPSSPQSSSRWIVALVAGVVLVAVGVAATVALLPTLRAKALGAAASGAPGAPGVAGPKQYPTTSWFDRTTPIPVSFVGDGTEDIAGIVDGYTPTVPNTHHVAVIDGKTLAVAWKSAPIERGSGASDNDFPMVVVGSRIVVLTGIRSIKVYDGASGRQLLDVEVSAKARGLCAPRAATKEIFVELNDAKPAGVTFDIETGASRPSPLPPGCGLSDVRTMVGRDGFASCKRHALCWLVERATAPDSHVVADGDLGIGVSTEKTGEKYVFGYDVRARKLLWKRPHPLGDESSSVIDVWGDRALSQSSTTAKLHVEFTDVSSGRLLWSYEPPPPDPAFPNHRAAAAGSVGSTRVYLNRMYFVDVLDKATGKFIGRVGEENR